MSAPRLISRPWLRRRNDHVRDAVSLEGHLAGWRRAAAAAAAVGVLVAAVGLALVMQRPPAPVPASAPVDEFSGERAWEHLERIVQEPTPVGAGNDWVRDYLTGELEALGLEVEVQPGLGAYAFGSSLDAGPVENVVATLPGSDPTGRVILAAHYDTTYVSPGASDDKAAVAAMLEAARALTSGGTPRNDVVFLLTDGEEPGLLGAAAFVDQHPYGRDADSSVVLNWEAVGNAGPSALFQTSEGNAGLIDAFARAVPRPVGDAQATIGFSGSSSNTDLTVFLDAGFAGLNFALLDGHAYYESTQDTVANLDPRSVQHHGDNMVALTRELGGLDIATLDTGSDAVYLSVFGQVVRFPVWLTWPLGGLAVLAVAAVWVLARRRGLATAPRLLAGAACALLPLAAAPAAAFGLWQVLLLVRPAYAQMENFEVYRPGLYRWAVVALTTAVVLAWYLLLRRRVGAVALAAGALAWPALWAVAVLLQDPATSYDTLPVLAVAAGMLVALLVPGNRPAWRVAALTLGAAPGLVINALSGTLLLTATGIGFGGAIAAAVFALAGLFALPVVGLAAGGGAGAGAGEAEGAAATARGRWLRALTPVAAALLAVALTAAGLAADRFDQDHPEVAHLAYLLDETTGTAVWMSADEQPGAWVSASVPTRAEEDPPLPWIFSRAPAWTGEAEAAPLPAPELRVLRSSVSGDSTVLDLHVRSAREADLVTLHLDRPVEEVTLEVDGLPPVTVPLAEAEDPASLWPHELQLSALPASGVTLTLTLPGGGPLQVALTDYTAGLDQLPGFTPRPAGLTRSVRTSSELAGVGRIHQLDP